MENKVDVTAFNRDMWNKQAESGNKWTIPVNEQEISAARGGKLSLFLTPVKYVPADWFPPLKGLKVLALASGGGQQVPLFAAAGADVTSFDNSDAQLQRDLQTAEKYGLKVTVVQGDMKDLSSLERESFNFIFNPCSTCFTDDVRTVWQECSKVLKRGGTLLTGFFNPVALLFGDQEYEDVSEMKLLYKQPYSDLTSISEELRQKLMAANEPLVFGHSLSDQIGGLTGAGLAVTGFYEDYWGGAKMIDEFFPSFIALKAVKL